MPHKATVNATAQATTSNGGFPQRQLLGIPLDDVQRSRRLKLTVTDGHPVQLVLVRDEDDKHQRPNSFEEQKRTTSSTYAKDILVRL